MTEDGDEDYPLLKRVVDALMSHATTPEVEQSAEHLRQRGYLFWDSDGRLRLSESGKRLLRTGARS